MTMWCIKPDVKQVSVSSYWPGPDKWPCQIFGAQADPREMLLLALQCNLSAEHIPRKATKDRLSQKGVGATTRWSPIPSAAGHQHQIG